MAMRSSPGIGPWSAITPTASGTCSGPSLRESVSATDCRPWGAACSPSRGSKKRMQWIGGRCPVSVGSAGGSADPRPDQHYSAPRVVTARVVLRRYLRGTIVDLYRCNFSRSDVVVDCELTSAGERDTIHEKLHLTRTAAVCTEIS